MKIVSKKLAFWIILAGLTVLSCELGARLVFAILVGSNVLFYGMGTSPSEVKSFPSVVMAKTGYTPPTPENYLFVSRGDTYVKFSPNESKTDTDENGTKFHPTINKRGFRGKEFFDRKKAGVIRIVTLGASSTFGYHNRDDQTYPYYMETLLNNLPGRPNRFEVINLGIPHIDSAQILSLFVAEALPLQPDVVTFYEGWNDATKTAAALNREPKSFDAEGFTSIIANSVSGMKNHSLIAALFDSLFYYVADSDVVEADLQHIIEKSTLKFLGNISLMREACRRQNIQFILANQQSRSQFIEKQQIKGVTFQKEVQVVYRKLRSTGRLSRREVVFLVHSSMMKDLRAWSRINDVPFVDVIHALDVDRSVLLTYVHLSPKANRIVAQEFVKEISKRF